VYAVNAELAKTFAGRPAFVAEGTGRVAIGVHDGWYLQERTKWRQRLSEAHPDHGGASVPFMRVRRLYETWAVQERRWYARYGLMPPRTGQPRRHVRVSKVSRLDRIAGLLSDGAWHTVGAVSATAGVTSQHLCVLVHRLRQRGFQIAHVTLDGQSFYQLLSQDAA